MADVSPLEPWIGLRDLAPLGETRWEAIDEAASRWLGRTVFALPSVRIGLCWMLQSLSYVRHRDHVLVPRFMGRCILNSISRLALPVEVPTERTRMALVVDQYGMRQHLESLTQEFTQRGWVYAEDSPYGVQRDESPGPGSLGRFIGLAKPLPIAMGALLATDRDDVADGVIQQRRQWSSWSLLAWTVMVALRLRRSAGGASTLAEIAYELYPAARGGHRWMRGNIARVLMQVDAFEAETDRRAAAAASALDSHLLWTETPRVGYVVPCFAGTSQAALSAFRRHGCDANLYHVDVARNLLTPSYETALLLPLNPRLPRQTFDALLNDLRLIAERMASHGADS